MDFPVTVLYTQTSLLELFAVACGLASVWFMKKENILVYPLGILNVLIYVYICYSEGLYAYAGINVFYAGMSAYGWVNWLRKDDHQERIRITRLTNQAIVFYVFLIIALGALLWFGLKTYTDSELPFWDAATTSVYVIAMWLLARKKIEHWLLWIAGDTVSVGLFGFLGLYFSAFQFLVFTIIAVLGFREWNQKLGS